jgi:hypothetical protein
VLDRYMELSTPSHAGGPGTTFLRRRASIQS